MNHSIFLRLVCLSVIALGSLWPNVAFADDQVDYLTEVKPLLAAKCYACHGTLKQEAGLRLETLELMDEGGVLVPGDAVASTLIERIVAEDDMRMPPPAEGSALKPAEIDVLRRWIDQGARAPEEAIPESPLQHWAFQRIERPDLPPHAPEHANPIDAFLQVKHAALNLTPVPPADRALQLRRVYLDLIGLPPTRAQLHDDRPWETIVDELLQDPQHGPRWARHWMDIWRYSDWYGLGAQLRYSQKHMWHWRDWIIDAVNTDKGYDRMIQEMLAGDELAPDDPEAVAGTGFLARNYYLFNRTTWLDSTIEHTGKAFLGLTLNCAKCHDHKYDPITHVDYYSFRAIFEPHQVRLDPVPGETDFARDGLPRVFDDQLTAETHLHLRGDPKQPDPDTNIQARVPALLASFQPDVQNIALPPTAFAPAVRDYVQRDLQTAADAEVEAAHQAWQQAQQAAAQATAQAAAQATDNANDTPAPFHLQDDFDGPNPEVWQQTGKGWKYEDGRLLQTIVTRDAEVLRLKQPLPRDFDLRCRYTTTGGDVYKSVTFHFDDDDDGRYNQIVYTSAHAPGPKVQVALTRDGQTQYPPEGRVGRPIEIGKTYELRFAVRDRLLNVWLDNEFLLAFALPDRRPEGQLTLSGFDATVAFDAITIESLAPEVPLTPASGAATTPADLQAAAKLAEAKWTLATANRRSLQSSLAADTARFTEQDPQQAEALAQQAAIDQAQVLRCQAEHDLLAAAGDAKKLEAAQTLLKQAEAQLQKAQQGEATYTSVRASVKALETPEHKESDYPAVYPATSSGRRLALARWMTSRENPLTARVAVNHVWTRHFGEPLVESVFDFGLRAKPPLHQDLLDYLACELIESGWSLRHLHRLMCTSEAYRRDASTANATATTIAADPANTTYWHANTRRMEAQVVRDAVLHLAGTLDLSIGGPSVDADSDSRRRSVYFKHSRDDLNKFLSMFDDADLLQCYRRSESVVPQQALAMANSKLTLTTAAQIAAKISQSSAPRTTAETIEAIFETILGRLPSDEERAECEQYCQQMMQLTGVDAEAETNAIPAKVQARLVHVLLNHNDFVSIR